MNDKRKEFLISLPSLNQTIGNWVEVLPYEYQSYASDICAALTEYEIWISGKSEADSANAVGWRIMEALRVQSANDRIPYLAQCVYEAALKDSRLRAYAACLQKARGEQSVELKEEAESILNKNEDLVDRLRYLNSALLQSHSKLVTDIREDAAYLMGLAVTPSETTTRLIEQREKLKIAICEEAEPTKSSAPKTKEIKMPVPVVEEAEPEHEPVVEEVVPEPEPEPELMPEAVVEEVEPEPELMPEAVVEEVVPEPEPEPEPIPEPVVEEVEPEPIPEPEVEEVEPEPEPMPEAVVEEVVPEPEPEPMAEEVAQEPEPIPEPVVEEVAQEPEPIPEPVVEEVAPEPEPIPEPVAEEVEPEPEPMPEPVAEEVAQEPEPIPEPVVEEVEPEPELMPEAVVEEVVPEPEPIPVVVSYRIPIMIIEAIKGIDSASIRIAQGDKTSIKFKDETSDKEEAYSGAIKALYAVPLDAFVNPQIPNIVDGSLNSNLLSE